MAVEDYKNGSFYEILIRTAFECPRGMKYGADGCFMQNAMTMERGETFASHLGPFEKQFNIVKTHIRNALQKLNTKKLYSENDSFFQNQLDILEGCTSTKQLMIVVHDSLDKIVELRNDNIK